VPNPQWQAQYDALTADNQWLAGKVDRKRRLREHAEYLTNFVPELFSIRRGGLVIDLGPGPGELLELTREMGFDVLGIDAKNGTDGMGDEYLTISKLMAERQELPIEYCGLKKFTMQDDPALAQAAVLINSRGSIEQMFSAQMEGAPHHLHHDSNQLSWLENGSTIDQFVHFFRICTRLLNVGGFMLIHANGAQNSGWYCKAIVKAAEECGGLRLLMREGLVHKWVRETS
jgi:hypothetical protein